MWENDRNLQTSRQRAWFVAKKKPLEGGTLLTRQLLTLRGLPTRTQVIALAACSTSVWLVGSKSTNQEGVVIAPSRELVAVGPYGEVRLGSTQRAVEKAFLDDPKKYQTGPPMSLKKLGRGLMWLRPEDATEAIFAKGHLVSLHSMTSKLKSRDLDKLLSDSASKNGNNFVEKKDIYGHFRIWRLGGSALVVGGIWDAKSSTFLGAITLGNEEQLSKVDLLPSQGN